MPRKARPPQARSDGEMTQGNLTPIGSGQPNGTTPRSALTQAAAAGAGMPTRYGQAQELSQAVSQTPAPPGIHPLAHAARQAASAAGLINAQGQLSHPGVTPLMAPSERPWEPVTAGAPLDAGPTNPMAAPMPGAPGVSVAAILEQAAQATGDPTLEALAQRAAAIAGGPSPLGA